MPTYLFRCEKCSEEREETLLLANFQREMEFKCEKCGCETAHHSIPVGGAFSCKGAGWPTANSRLKSDRKKKSSKKTQVMVNREKSGEGVKSIKDLSKPIR